MNLRLSKTGLGMCMRYLDRFLWLDMYAHGLPKTAKNSLFWPFGWKHCGTSQSVKIDLSVVDTFWDRFWKVQSPYFPFLNFFQKFGTFCNPNGIPQVCQKNATFLPPYRFGYKKVSKFINLLMQIKYLESMNPGLSKTGLGMSLRLFVMILWSFEVLSSWVEKEWEGHNI